MLNLKQTQQLCRQYSIVPSHLQGQNFLIDGKVIDSIIKEADLKSDDVVLEVGPGFGVLTERLVGVVGQVVAVEKDARLVEFLQQKFSQSHNLTVVNGDILTVNLSQLALSGGRYKIVANLPYSITSRFLRIFLDLKGDFPTEMTIMVQKEVAQRLTAPAGAMSVLSVMAQFYAEVKVLFEVSRQSFWPSPDVDSAVVSLKLKSSLPDVDTDKFFRLVKIGFSSRRKQLHNNLSGGLKLDTVIVKRVLTDLGFDEKVRAQELSVGDWLRLLTKLDDL